MNKEMFERSVDRAVDLMKQGVTRKDVFATLKGEGRARVTQIMRSARERLGGKPTKIGAPLAARADFVRRVEAIQAIAPSAVSFAGIGALAGHSVSRASLLDPNYRYSKKTFDDIVTALDMLDEVVQKTTKSMRPPYRRTAAQAADDAVRVRMQEPDITPTARSPILVSAPATPRMPATVDAALARLRERVVSNPDDAAALRSWMNVLAVIEHEDAGVAK